ncbi:aspartate--tRNA ligase [Calditerricola yamamurae]|jgi:aspartyl-tRNA synthetase, bacterial type|nr:aspartate--tRNA ligase [Bacillota bacterium]
MWTIQRSHWCGELRSTHVGTEVALNGWVHRRRDLGDLIFIDLRDRTGLVQLVFDPSISKEAHAAAKEVRSEYVLAVRGQVVARTPETVNPNLATGEVEVQVHAVEVVNTAKTPPFVLDDRVEVDESVRLKYRYLDLRRPVLQQTLMLRHRAAKAFRDFLDARGFVEIETPMLTRSTPEGARDYLVPSRVHPGQFYALPQSPQLFKQLLMVAGFERYFQIVRCFRDEDLRADRQPEFTQVDIETSFLRAEQIQELVEELTAYVWKETIGVDVPRPFPRLSYQEALDRYGTDKPDIRFGLELKDVSDIAAACQFQVFRRAVEAGGRVQALNAKGCAGFSRKEIAAYEEEAKRHGAKGLAYLARTAEGWKGPIAKFFTEGELAALAERLEAKVGDLLFFCADQADVVAAVLGNLRLKLGRERGLIPDNTFAFLWVTDFPLLTYDEEEGRFVANHHPFTMPREDDIPLFDTDPARIRAQAYDLVCNGYEIAGGSIRIHRRDVQEKMFRALGFTEEQAREKFGFLLEAFEYGTPPHGGIAFGFDRVVMLLAGRSNLRETIAFPKTTSAADLMVGAPSPVDPRQLDELRIAVIDEARATR